MAGLQLCTYTVREVVLGSETRWSNDVLTIDRRALAGLCADTAIASLKLSLVAPGEQARILHVLDAVEPRVKVQGPGCAFPGTLGPAITAGQGRTHRLQGVLVMPSSLFPNGTQGTLAYRDSMVDMTSPGKAFSFGADSWNIVLELAPAPGVTNAEYGNAMRRTALRTAAHLAEATCQVQPDIVEDQTLQLVSPELPRVVAIIQVQSQGELVDTLLYGAPLAEMMPTLIDPDELTDGALVSANYKGSMRVPTAAYCNHPVVQSLRAAHGRSICFSGVVISRGHHANDALKQRSAEYAAKLARLLGAEGVIMQMEGTGNGTLDYMWTARACERLGIRAVAITHELSGAEGKGPPLVESVPEAVALVSTGNTDMRVDIPAVPRVVGGSHLQDRPAAAMAQNVAVNDFFGSHLQMGMSGLRDMDY